MLEDAGVETPAAQHDAPSVRGLRVREMQTKLHRWAAADPGFRFDDLLQARRRQAHLQRFAFVRVVAGGQHDHVSAAHVDGSAPTVQKGPQGWRQIALDGVELFNIGAVAVTRYRWRGLRIPTPWAT